MKEAAIAIAAMKESLLHEDYSEFEEGEGLLVTARRLTGYDAGNWDEVPSEVSKFFDIEDIDSILVTEYKDFYVEE